MQVAESKQHKAVQLLITSEPYNQQIHDIQYLKRDPCGFVSQQLRKAIEDWLTLR